jgi:hypothetical protein
MNQFAKVFRPLLVAMVLPLMLNACKQKPDGQQTSGTNATTIPSALVNAEDPLEKSNKTAESVQCISNLKQIGLGFLLWANDHNGAFPRDFLSLTNSLDSCKVFLCPGDTVRKVTSWADVKTGDLSYKVVSIGPMANAKYSDLVLVQCHIHGHICLSDGSVLPGSMELQNRLKSMTDGTAHLLPAPK